MIFYLVANDTASVLKATIVRNDTGVPIVMTDNVGRLKVKKRNSATVLFTITGTGTTQEKIDGTLNFAFGNNLVGLPKGIYEAEIEVTYPNLTVESVFELLTLNVRADF